jgi:hypothetical protein
MITAATRQDMQGIVDYAKNTILGQMVSRGQLQTVAEQIRATILQNLHELHAENQQLIHQSHAQRQVLINRLSILEQEVKSLHQAINRLLTGR